MFYLRLSVLLLPVFIFFSNQLLEFSSKSLIPIIIGSTALIIIWVFGLFKKSENKNIGNWLDFSVLPVFFNLSSILYFSIEQNIVIGQFVLLVNAFFLFHYFKNIYYLIANSENRNEQLKNISFFCGILLVFFSASFAYGIKAFLGYPLLPVLIGLSLMVVAAWYQIFIFGTFSLKKNINFFLVALLSLLQIATVLFLLPFSYHLLGMIMTLAFYFVVGIGRLKLQGIIPKKQLKYYLIFTTLLGFLLLLTARWL